MKKHLVFPAPQLSQLKEADVELEMTGRHYMLLATSEGEMPEEIVLSIVNDLMDGDASKLTLNELRYVFTMIKINSLENDYSVSVKCNNFNLKTQKKCGHVNKININLAESDLNKCPDDYKVPEIDFYSDSKNHKIYKVMPPTVNMEIALLNAFTRERNLGLDVLKDPSELYNYNVCLSFLHLVDSEGNRLVNTIKDVDTLMKYLDYNSYKTIKSLLNFVAEVNSFGVQGKIYKCKCEECGSELSYQIPLLYGLVS